ncbi:unnamed protein product [Ambrosiozyma monospora]|uniref:Unnamed protein product n=1 Tax=Ambrosiozyma monospora TaxID=43982 RepID=A0ACB5U5V0_AMBMO|nr:unnamed protein product [Ambrosiozyma monospora]
MEDSMYLEGVKALGVRKIVDVHCRMEEGRWCYFVPYCREIRIQDYVGFEGWVKDYAEKVSTLTVKAYPDYLNSILKNKNSFKNLKNIIVQVNDDSDYPYEEPENEDNDYFKYLGPKRRYIMDSWYNHSYIAPLLKLTEQFDNVTMEYEGSASRLVKPELAKFYNQPKSVFHIYSLIGAITEKSYNVIKRYDINRLCVTNNASLKWFRKPIVVKHITISGTDIENYDFSKFSKLKSFYYWNSHIDAKSFNTFPKSLETIEIDDLKMKSDDQVGSFCLPSGIEYLECPINVFKYLNFTNAVFPNH